MAAGGGKSNFDCYFLCGKSESSAGDERRVTWVNRSPGARSAPPVLCGLYVQDVYENFYSGIDRDQFFFVFSFPVVFFFQIK